MMSRSTGSPPGPAIARDAPKRLLDDEAMLLAVWRSVVIARWKLLPTVAHMKQVRQAVRTVADRGTGFAAINFVEARKATTLAEDVRDEVAATQREFESRQRALATVIEGTGFWPATVRSVAVGLALMSRTKFPQRVFERTSDAASWVAPLLGDVGADGASALENALATVRSWA